MFRKFTFIAVLMLFVFVLFASYTATEPVHTDAVPKEIDAWSINLLDNAGTYHNLSPPGIVTVDVIYEGSTTAIQHIGSSHLTKQEYNGLTRDVDESTLTSTIINEEEVYFTVVWDCRNRNKLQELTMEGNFPNPFNRLPADVLLCYG